MRRRRHDSTEIALANFAITFAKALLVFCVVLFLLISNKANKDGVKPDAEYLITVDWSSTKGAYDVDTWLRLPDGGRVGYSNREDGVVFLERDDLGTDCHATTDDGRPTNRCQEVVVIRGVVTGEYILALHLFAFNHDATEGLPVPPVRVSVKIEKLNPTVQLVWQKIVTLDKVRQELRLTRFTIEQNGSIGAFSSDNLPSVVYQGLRQ